MNQESDKSPEVLDKDVEFLDISEAARWAKMQSFYIAPGKLLVLTEPRNTAPKYTLRIKRSAAAYFGAEATKNELERLGREREPGHNGWLNHEFEILGALRFETLHTAAEIIVSDPANDRPGQITVLANTKNTTRVQYHRIETLTQERERDSDVVLWGQVLLLINVGKQRLSWESLPYPIFDHKPKGSEDLTPDQAKEVLASIGEPFDPAAGELLGAVILHGGGLEIIVRDQDSHCALGIDVNCTDN